MKFAIVLFIALPAVSFAQQGQIQEGQIREIRFPDGRVEMHRLDSVLSSRYGELTIKLETGEGVSGEQLGQTFRDVGSDEELLVRDAAAGRRTPQTRTIERVISRIYSPSDAGHQNPIAYQVAGEKGMEIIPADKINFARDHIIDASQAAEYIGRAAPDVHVVVPTKTWEDLVKQGSLSVVRRSLKMRGVLLDMISRIQDRPNYETSYFAKVQAKNLFDLGWIYDSELKSRIKTPASEKKAAAFTSEPTVKASELARQIAREAQRAGAAR
jgi:hypothetical protein